MDKQVNPSAEAERMHLLLVDDDINLLELTSQLLYRKGYNVTPATGSSYAITILKKNYMDFDVIVTDLCMPGIDGIELAIMIKELSADIPVILHTAKVDLVDQKKIAQADIAEVITKPYKVEELDKIIKRVVKEKRSNSHLAEGIAA